MACFHFFGPVSDVKSLGCVCCFGHRSSFHGQDLITAAMKRWQQGGRVFIVLNRSWYGLDKIEKAKFGRGPRQAGVPPTSRFAAI